MLELYDIGDHTDIIIKQGRNRVNLVMKDSLKKIISEKRSFPGYILIKMEMNDKNWYFVRNTPKVTGFVGSGKKPIPLSEKEVATILKHIEVTQETPKPKYHFDVGDAVKIIDGPFLNFNGIVDDVQAEKNLLKVIVTIFGRPTPVDLTILQVEKI